MVPVSTLAALAQGTDGMHILPALDARMQQVYWGAYRRNPDGMVEPVQAETVTNPDSVFVPDDSGWISHPLLPVALLALTAAAVFLLWRTLEARVAPAQSRD